MRTTEIRLFCGRDSDGPIILIGGTKEKICGVEMIQYFQNPGLRQQNKFKFWEGRIKMSAACEIKETLKEDCDKLISCFFPYATVKYVTMEEVLQ